MQRDVWSLFDVAWAPEDGGTGSYLTRILDRCTDWFGATGSSLFLREGGSDGYWLAAKAGSHCTVPDTAAFVQGEGIAGTSVVEGKPVIVGNPLRDPLLAKSVRAARKDIASAMVVPLVSPDSGCIGVLNLSRKKGLPPFRDRDLSQARSIGGHIALAIANARLYANLHEARQEAVQAHTKLQSILESLGVAVLVFDSDAQIQERNLVARRLLCEQQLETAAGDRLNADSPSPLASGLRAALDEALQGSMSRRQARDERDDRAWSIVSTPLPGVGATVAIEDITDHERSLRDVARVRRLAEIGQMTASIAHEIRNPLTGILSAAQMVKEAPEHGTELADIIGQEVGKLNGLCEQFLEFAKPVALRHEPFQLAELARRVVRQHEGEFRECGVRLSVEIEPDQPMISGDPPRTEQVLYNLLRNAREACSPGGAVIVQAGRASLSVEDTGSGMPPDVVERLFTPFFTTKSSGTGLGMSNVRKIVEAHGGAIEVTSEVGKGTKIEITLEDAA